MAKAKNEKVDFQKEIENSVKMFDVSKPGETPASATSRPIIVGHSPMIKHDPMMKKAVEPETEPEKDEAEKEEIKPRLHSEKVLTPIGAETKEPKAAKDTKDAPADKPETTDEPETKAKPETKKDTKLTPEKEEEPEEKSEVPTSPPKEESTGAVEVLANEVDAKQANKKQQADLEAKYQELEKSIEKKEFFVPIGQVSRRRSNRNAVIFLLFFLILAAGAVNFAVDAELIDIGMDSFTDIL